VDAWREALGDLLTREEASAILGSEEELVRAEAAGELIVLTQRSGQPRYPAFQLVNGRPLPALAQAHRTLSGECSDWTGAAWAVAPNPHLAGRSPLSATMDGDDARVQLVAERDAAALAH
jgi:hypothetical protein